MFSALTVNSPLYIFTKGEQPKLEIGQVENVTKPHPTFAGQYPSFNQPMDMVIDLVTVRIGDEIAKFENLSSNASMHACNSGSVVVSDSKDLILSEIENVQRTSKSILDSMQYHENMVAKCDEFLKLLNPQIIENERRDKALGKLENDMAELKKMLSDVLGKSKTV